LTHNFRKKMISIQETQNEICHEFKDDVLKEIMRLEKNFKALNREEKDETLIITKELGELNREQKKLKQNFLITNNKFQGLDSEHKLNLYYKEKFVEALYKLSH